MHARAHAHTHAHSLTHSHTFPIFYCFYFFSLRSTKTPVDSEMGRMVCVGGACAWKVKGKEDDVLKQIRSEDASNGKKITKTEFEVRKSREQNESHLSGNFS